MTDPVAISIHHLGKRYRKGSIGAATLREEIENLLARLRGEAEPASDTIFNALKDVSFDIPAGRVCGIIGRNGSGKTTLLKILSGITAPDSGQAVLRGRVGSLLEVGAGFHPDLDGVENIFLNGAVLGMTRKEINSKLDEIVAFAGIGDFLRTPVKRYSSGMYVRLAFSVAAHLEPEILIVDEVLAVGDAEFQRRCIGKMKTVTSQGRTVVFVSHNMATVRQLCDMVVHLDKGEVVRTGDPDTVIQAYLGSTAATMTGEAVRESDGFTFNVLIRERGSEEALSTPVFGRSYEIALWLTSMYGIAKGSLKISISDQEGTRIAVLDTLTEGLDLFDINTGATIEFVFDLPDLPLVPGIYTISAEVACFGEPEPESIQEDILSFEVVAGFVNGAHRSYDRDHGFFRLARNVRYEHL